MRAGLSRCEAGPGCRSKVRLSNSGAVRRYLVDCGDQAVQGSSRWRVSTIFR